MITFTITLDNKTGKKFEKILRDEDMTPEEWLDNAVNDYDS